MAENVVNKLMKTIENANSKQFKSLWDAILENTNKLNTIDDELHSSIPTKKGLSYQVDDLNQAIMDIKRIIYIGVGAMLAINILPRLKEIFTLLKL